jgi:hypothetical protein
MTSPLPPGRGSLHRYPGTSYVFSIGLPARGALRFGLCQSVARSGQKSIAQGFNPGNQPIKGFALKGREERVLEIYYNDSLPSCG